MPHEYQCVRDVYLMGGGGRRAITEVPAFIRHVNVSTRGQKTKNKQQKGKKKTAQYSCILLRKKGDVEEEE